MKISDLMSPGNLANGIKLRVEAAKAISSVEVTAARMGGANPAAGQLAAAFTSWAAGLAGLYETTAPTVSSRTVTSATVITVVFSEAMDTSILPLPTAFAISGDTFTGIKWVNGTTLELKGTGFAAAESLAYTKPATNYLRDRSGNAVATNTGTLS